MLCLALKTYNGGIGLSPVRSQYHVNIGREWGNGYWKLHFHGGVLCKGALMDRIAIAKLLGVEHALYCQTNYVKATR
jgi:hypothetical protein